ncbi:WYL domain-containing protein [Proteiniclasticum sp. SCR006]|uniref:WYL domain-containing protein n=1 Tax=Proteiniclasticum aestuarii TaxID=2817862 RepID=A0A939KHY2_9CLOT|nr:WYL domain-containing protein [Proteiniclasticum aestuarii]MBO1263578.1 WYL domain-containing protein [Proteiniclasticum aestuarii]
MAKNGSHKLKILYLMKMFLEQTDEEHSIGIADIIRELENYGISAERKSIYADIDTLKVFGLDISKKKSKSTEYYLASREFELPELKLLVDAVQCSKFVTHKKSNELIKKIESLTSKKQAMTLQRQVYVANRAKSINENIYYNVDKLHQAIADNRKVSFQYFDYNLDKEKVFRKDGERYVISPYSLSWDDENYYVIAYYKKHDNFVHYRVDRMSSIELMDDMRDLLNEDTVFNVAEYAKQTFNMFNGVDEVVWLEFDNDLVNQVLDRFGADISIQKETEETFSIRTRVKVSSTFFSWVAQYGKKARIMQPQHVRDEFTDFLAEILKQY